MTIHRDRPLAPCPSCNRHVAAEPVCPFCGEVLDRAPVLRSTLPGRFSRAAVFAGATLAGCSSKSQPPAPAPEPVAAARDAQVAQLPPDAAADAAIDAPTRARLVGRLLTHDGVAIRGLVAVISEEGSQGERHEAKADAKGFFTFEDLAPGDYALAGGGAQHAIHLEAGTNHQDLVLPPPPVRMNNMPYGAPPARYRLV